MSKGLPLIVRDHVEKCRHCAIAAVDTYNRPGPQFRSAQFIVLIVMAWTSLFHAIFFRRGRKPWFRKKVKAGRAVRYIKIDGEPKHWDLAECLKEYYGSSTSPPRRNLEFLIGLRNKIEHRHLPQLDATLYGECQASLMNLESLLVSEFGSQYALTEQLGIALQFSQVVPEAKATALKAATRTAAAPVIEYIESFRGKLPPSVLESMSYSFAVYLVPRVANRAKAADAAVTFVRVDEASPEELARLEKLNVLIRERKIPIANLDLHKPSEVVSRVAPKLPHLFNLHHHTRAWRHYKVRPSGSAAKKDRTDERYCVYDAAHDDYLYTEAWITKLVDDLADAARFEAVTGQEPRTRSAD